MGRGQEVTSSRSGWGECGRHARQRGAHALGGQPRWGGDARGRPRAEGGKKTAGLAGAEGGGVTGRPRQRAPVRPPAGGCGATAPRLRAPGGVRTRTAGASSPPRARAARSGTKLLLALPVLRQIRTGEGWGSEGEKEGLGTRSGLDRESCQVLARHLLSKCASWNLEQESLRRALGRNAIGNVLRVQTCK